MKKQNRNSKLWKDLAKMVHGVPGAVRHIEKLKEHCRDIDPGDSAFIELDEGEAYEKALEMLTAKVRNMAEEETFGRLAERTALKEREFWLAVYEETGLDDQDSMAFVPGAGARGAIRTGAPKQTSAPESYQATLNHFKELVQLFLGNPVVAGQMAHDPCLPPWLQEMASAITSGSLKPTLRRVIEDCAAEPGKARDWHALAAKNKLPDWFVEMTSILGARQRSSL